MQEECASPVWKHGTQLPVIAVLARVDSLQVNMEGYGWRPELLLACGCHDTRHHKPVDVKLACWLGMVLLQASLSGVCSSLILLPPQLLKQTRKGTSTYAVLNRLTLVGLCRSSCIVLPRADMPCCRQECCPPVLQLEQTVGCSASCTDLALVRLAEHASCVRRAVDIGSAGVHC